MKAMYIYNLHSSNKRNCCESFQSTKKKGHVLQLCYCNQLEIHQNKFNNVSYLIILIKHFKNFNIVFNLEYEDLLLILVLFYCVVIINFVKRIFGNYFTLGNALGSPPRTTLLFL
jgi:hypothetical protein